MYTSWLERGDQTALKLNPFHIMSLDDLPYLPTKQVQVGVGFLAWKWIRISLDSQMVVQMESGTKTKSYKPVSQITCVCVSFVLVLNVHIPLYLSSRRKPFLRTLKFFCSLVPVSIISIRISFLNCHFFISGHY